MKIIDDIMKITIILTFLIGMVLIVRQYPFFIELFCK